MLILDSGALTHLSERSRSAAAVIARLRAAGLWRPVVPTTVLVESLRGEAGRDANANRFLKGCIVEPRVSEVMARRAAALRRRARRGSAVDALVVALAEPGGIVLTGDRADIEALAAHARQVAVEVV
ncbi:MAG TPA: PIN domain-containing protein [Acidimicrobiales bacterium]|nr:PIN domain-containing protein [Acidimicrobiales bacterium]